MAWRLVSGRRGAWAPMVLVLVLLASAASLVLLGPSMRAGAATTAVSTVYKTGTDPATSSTAASADAPGGAVTGTAHPGDTVNWVVSYENNTGHNATVNMKDPLGTAGTYVPGSLQLPPNPDGTQPFAPQYSTDNGATWQPGTPPAGATGVGLTGTFPPSTQQQSVNPVAPVSVNLSNLAGDGYNAVSSPDGTLVYAVFHHNNTNTAVFCATTSGGLCPGWPTGSNTTATFVSPVAGTPIGTGTNGGLTTGIQNGTFLAKGNLYWVAQQTTAVSGRYPVGVMCLNLTTLQSCGFTQLDSVLAAPAGGTSGQISGTGIAASDGNHYYLDSDGNLLCFSPATGECGVIPTVSPTAGSMPASYTYGNIVFGQIQPSGASTYSLTCYNVTTGSSCPGYPVSPTTPPSSAPYAQAHATPVLNSAGTITGACVLNNSVSYGCWNLAGAPIANPYPAGAGSTTNETGDALVLGTKVYLPVSGDGRVGCYDFATYTGTGTIPACTGFTTVANPSNYTVRPMTGNPSCLLADGDGKKITSFDALTGGVCSSTTATETVHPVDYYCGTGSGAFRAWNQLTLTGLPAGSYSGAEVTLTDANGNPVPGFTNVTLPTGTTTLNISSIPVTAPTNQLTVQVTFHSATAAITSGQVSVTWQGDPPQMCFQTKVPAVACGTTAAVSNAANVVTNASASGGASDAPGGNSSGAAQFTVTPGAGQCQVTFGKTASPARARPGSTVTYTITVRNTGTLDFTAADPASFTDDLTSVLANASYGGNASATSGSVSYAAPALSWSGPLAAGATATVTYTATVNANATSDNQDLANTVTSGSPGSNCTSAAPAAVCTADVPVDAITIVKSVSPGTVHAAGDVVTYSFLVTNTGSETLHDITVNDTQAPPSSQGGLSPITCPVTTLAAGASTTCTATYAVTQADVDHGQVDDAATATGTPPGGPPVTSPRSPASVTAAPAPGISIVKSASVSDTAHFTAGQLVTYTFVVTNTGNVTLAPVTVTDTGFTGTGTLSPISCPAGGGTDTVPSLTPGTQAICTASYTLTTADIDAGTLSDTGNTKGTPPTGPDVTGDSPLTIPAPQHPAITIVKSVSPATVHAAGDLVTYRFIVTNTGNTTLNAVTVDDTQLPPASQAGLSAVSCPDTTLAPGQFTTCTATYNVTQADIDHGRVDDSATATGTPPGAPPVTSPPSTGSVTADQVPGISVVKSASPSDAARFTAGQLVTYTFVATNTGNVTLAPVTVTDTGFTGTGTLSPVSCPPGGTGTLASLAPGAQAICTATYTLTQADIDAGHVADTGNATGTPPTGADVTADSPVDIPAPQHPALAIAKGASPTTVHAAGDQVTYRFTVTNTGNLTLHGVTVDDTQLPPASQAGLTPVSCPDTTLAPGQFTTCTATYTVTQADIDHGQIDDTATATGTPPSGPPVTSPPAGLTIPAGRTPADIVVKTSTTARVTHAGQKVPYAFLVTNTGNVTLHHVTVTDKLAPPSAPANLTPVTCPQLTLPPGAKETCTATYTATQADVDHGRLDDTATVTGTPPATPGNPTPSPLPPSKESTVSVPAAQHPGIAVLKTVAKDPPSTVGPQVRYSFLVDNTGNVTLHDVGVTDVMTPPAVQANLSAVTCPHATLAPRESMTCTATYATTPADVARGSVGNTATAYGTPPSGLVIRSRPHTISAVVTGGPAAGSVVIPTGEGANAAAPGASPGLAAAGATALAAGTLLLLRRRARRRRGV